MDSHAGDPSKSAIFRQLGLFGSRLKVRELRGKLTNLLSEKRDIVSLKTQVEEQYEVIAAQLKAKVETSRFSFKSIQLL